MQTTMKQTVHFNWYHDLQNEFSKKVALHLKLMFLINTFCLTTMLLLRGDIVNKYPLYHIPPDETREWKDIKKGRTMKWIEQGRRVQMIKQKKALALIDLIKQAKELLE